MRLFVALDLPDHIQEQLAEVCRGIPGARWVDADSLHLTLRFIGEVDRHLANDLDDTLSRITWPAFMLSLAGLGQFGEDHKLRSLWVGVDPNPELMALRERVEQAVQRAGARPERRKYKPHVTLARFRNHPGEKLGNYFVNNSPLRLPPFQVQQFVLFSSYNSSSGPIYRAEAVYPLTAPATASL